MTQQGDRPVLRIERRFDVAPETVFDTLTIPDQMRVWWGENVEFEIDLRVDGEWTITRTEEGETYVATGTYLEVERPSRLSYSFAMPQFSDNADTITVTIEGDESGCLVIFEHAGEDIAEELQDLEEGETSATEMGWQEGFDLMAAAWAQAG